MHLGDLLEDLTLDAATGRVEVADVQVDSRECGPGSLFFAMPGATTSGSAFASDAVARGAVAVVADRALSVGAPVVVVPESRLRGLLAEASATVVGHPESSLDLVGVTGTNGKTTVVTLVAGLARALGWAGSTVGTLTGTRTTPPSPELFRSLAQRAAAAPGAARSIVAVEVSSHALVQGRVDGLTFAVAAFTNLGHDHLDYHPTMEDYFAAKASLFTPERARRAVVWVDDPFGARLADQTRLPVARVSRADALDVSASWRGTSFYWRDRLVTTELVGGYHVDNALVAMAVVAALGASDAEVADALALAGAVPGRFEVVARDPVTVVVDYAHTPEGLERLLGDVRALSPTGRVVAVFGCGGERDHAKRPLMGAAAARLADEVVVTSDNPRAEDPEAIIDEVVAGVPAGAGLRREPDRRRAIGEALARAARGDVVVVAGKGHETTQTLGATVTPFDDREVVRELLGAPC